MDAGISCGPGYLGLVLDVVVGDNITSVIGQGES
jgi:hypothetical protein